MAGKRAGKWTWRRLLTWGGLILGLIILGRLLVQMSVSVDFPLEDFVEYWSAGRLNLRGENPYGQEQMLAMQQGLGWTRSRPLMMYSPPWVLALLMPFAWPGYQTGWTLWVAVEFIVVFFCSIWIWNFYGGDSRYRFLPLLIAFTFLPVLAAFNLVQISPFMLLGIVAFLYFEHNKKWALAGASTVLVAIKPQLLYLFWVALFFWILDRWDRRRGLVMLGGIVTGLAAMLVAMAFNPGLLGQYWYLVQHNALAVYLPPTGGTALRLWFGIDNFWLHYVPPVLGLIWFVFYWTRHRQRWQWAEQVPLLFLVSLCTTSYGWLFDQVVLLLPVIQMSVWLVQARQPILNLVAVMGHFLLTAAGIGLRAIEGATEFWYWWTAPVLLLIYWLARQQIGPEVVPRSLLSVTLDDGA